MELVVQIEQQSDLQFLVDLLNRIGAKFQIKSTSTDELLNTPLMRSQIERSLQDFSEGKTSVFSLDELEDENSFFETLIQKNKELCNQ